LFAAIQFSTFLVAVDIDTDHGGCMELDEVEIIELELKYCERCGGLWLRICGSERVYCGACAEKSRERGERKAVFRTKNEVVADGPVEELALLCGEGGNA